MFSILLISKLFLRFVRKLVGCHDRYFDNHIVSENLLLPIVELFLQNGDKYNLLNSTVLELFEFIGDIKQTRFALIKYYGEKLHERLKHIPFTFIFKNLFMSYQKLGEFQHEVLQLNTTPLQPEIQRKSEPWLDKEELPNQFDDPSITDPAKKRFREDLADNNPKKKFRDQ